MRWWCRKYKRPVNDVLLQGRSYASLYDEMLADIVNELVMLEHELRESDKPGGELHRRGNELRGMLGIKADIVDDPLAQSWFDAVDAGQPLPASFFDTLPADLREMVTRRKKRQTEAQKEKDAKSERAAKAGLHAVKS